MESAKLRAWIESILQREMKGKDLESCLKNGQELCNLINTLQPGALRVVHTDENPIRCQENISRFVAKVHEIYEIPFEQLFEASDLYANKNIMSVVSGLQLLRRKVEDRYPAIAQANRDAEIEEHTAITMEQVKQVVVQYKDQLTRSRIERRPKEDVEQPIVTESPRGDDTKPSNVLEPEPAESSNNIVHDKPHIEVVPSAMATEGRPKSPGKRVTFMDNEVSSVVEVPKEVQPVGMLLSCHFSLHYIARPDEQLVVVGNCSELGDWNPAAGLVLSCDVDPMHVAGTWSGTVIDLNTFKLPIMQSEFFCNSADVSRRQLRYKYCVVEKYDRFKIRRWEEGNDRIVLLSHYHRTPVLFQDWWQSVPRSSLSAIYVPSPQEDEGDDTIKLTFQIEIPDLIPGIIPRVVGDIVELGSWDATIAPECHRTSDNHYECVVYVLKGHGSMYYKYCLTSMAGRVEWEHGDNRRIMMPFIHAYQHLANVNVGWDGMCMNTNHNIITDNVYAGVYANDGCFWK
jgi:hypothetical protein